MASDLKSMSFSWYARTDAKSLSVVEVSNPITFDSLMQPTANGLYDVRMGPFHREALCATCGLSSSECAGHFGHVSLVLPVYNPMLFNLLFRVLRSQCMHCHKFKLAEERVQAFTERLRALDSGDVIGAEASTTAAGRKRTRATEGGGNWDVRCAEQRRKIVDDFLRASMLKKCENCSAHTPAFKKDGFNKLLVEKLNKKAAQSNATNGINLRLATADTSGSSLTDGNGSESDNDSDGEEGGDTPSHKQAGNINSEGSGSRVLLHAVEVERQIRLLFGEEKPILDLMWGQLQRDLTNGKMTKHRSCDPSIFFIYDVLVPPTRFRPAAMVGDDAAQHPHNYYLTKVLQTNTELKRLLSQVANNQKAGSAAAGGVVNESELQSAIREGVLQKAVPLLLDLQVSVNSLIDSGKCVSTAAQNPSGVRQLLEKKEGLFRKHMMGKRVNFAARSVISPDPNIETNEIGVPLQFALQLTYPQPVTSANIKQLRQAVINGPKVYPGANFIDDGSGHPINLALKSKSQRESIAKTLLHSASHTETAAGMKCKKVLRHMVTGDVMLVNRQPTLHKPGIMAHKARVLKNEANVIRMHYANCNTYNADFDGDEMNLHLPQSEMARAEAYDIVQCDAQYPSPTSGGPLRGLIQDHVIGGVHLTKRDSFLNRDEYQQLVYTAVFFAGNVGSSSTNASKSQQFSAGNFDIKPVAPAILKPQRLWTGKQVITTILNVITRDIPDGLGIYLQRPTKVPAAKWGSTPVFSHYHQKYKIACTVEFGPGAPVVRYFGNVHKVKWIGSPPKQVGKAKSAEVTIKAVVNTGGGAVTLSDGSKFANPSQDSEEGTVIIQSNELLTGVLEKSQFGATDFSLVHSMYEFYGPRYAGSLLTVLGRLFSSFLQWHGFTQGIDDLLVTDKANLHRKNILAGAHAAAAEASATFAEMDASTLNPHSFHDQDVVAHNLHVLCTTPEAMAKLDSTVKSKLAPITSQVIKECLVNCKPFPWNNFGLMTVSGAKGSIVNFSQICCLLGQQELEGLRVPRMASGKTLPSFVPFDLSPRAGGFIAQRFLTGIRPQEYYFHCMAGREGLVDTAVKTSRSGYLQRCLIKHMEGLIVQYDNTVRDTDGTVVQFNYGEDSLDVIGTSFLDPKHGFKAMAANIKSVLYKYDVKTMEKHINMDMVNALRAADSKNGVQGDPLLSRVNPAVALGCMSEVLEKQIDEYIKENPDGLLMSPEMEATIEAGESSDGKKKSSKRKSSSKKKDDDDVDSSAVAAAKKAQKAAALNPNTSGMITADQFRLLVAVKYLNTVVQPGESVGLLAAQGVGEPSTQMTLNTFHLAGHGGANVTLGIPRLREVLMTASANIRTPLMELPLIGKAKTDKAEAIRLSHRFNRVMLSDVIQSFSVSERVIQSDHHSGPGVRRYRVTVNIIEDSDIQERFGGTVSWLSVVNAVEKAFALKLDQGVAKILKTRAVSGRKDGEPDDEVIGRGQKASKLSGEGGASGRGEDEGGAYEAPAKESRRNEGTGAESSDEEDGDMDEADVEGGDGVKSRGGKGKRQDADGYAEADDEDERLLRKHGVGEDDDAAPMEENGSKPPGSTGMSGLTGPEQGGLSELQLEGDEGKRKRFAQDTRYVCTIEPNPAKQTIHVNVDVDPMLRKLLMLQLCEATAAGVMVYSVPHIKKCFVQGDIDKGGLFLQVEGVNFPFVSTCSDFVDVDNISSNDIAAIRVKYGVEAARASIFEQIGHVFGAYGIQVDSRHKTLIADYMTLHGGYKPFNRMGIDSNTSPLLKMSFETTATFLVSAATHGERDDLTSPASSIVLGKNATCGTGIFDCLQPLQIDDSKP